MVWNKVKLSGNSSYIHICANKALAASPTGMLLKTERDPSARQSDVLSPLPGSSNWFPGRVFRFYTVLSENVSLGVIKIKGR